MSHVPRHVDAIKTGPKEVRWQERGDGVETLTELLQDIYWKSVEKEIRGLIPALTEFMLCAPERTPEERLSPRPDPEKLNQFAKAWAYVHLSDEDQQSILSEYRDWSEEQHNKPLIESRARRMLQAMGWLDLSFVHQYRQPFYPSMAGLPKVEALECDTVFRAIQCSNCGECIRTHFFECAKGCLDRHSHKNYYKCLALPRNAQSNASHLLPRLPIAPVRLCFSCIDGVAVSRRGSACSVMRGDSTKSSFAEYHLILTNAKIAVTSEAERFSYEIATLEDEKAAAIAGKQAQEMDRKARDAERRVKEAKTAGKLTGEMEQDAKKARAAATDASAQAMEARYALPGTILSRISKEKARNLIPAGVVHMAFRFGTLTVENGVKGTQHGALITPREQPNISYNGFHIMIGDHPDDDPDIVQKVVVGQHPRKIWVASERRLKTRTLAVAKQVCGGLFANSMSSWTAAENRAVCLLVRAATDYRNCLSMMSTSSLRTRLHNAAATITSTLRRVVNDTVDQQIHFMSTLLCDESTKLEWSAVLNNCQKFCNKLLRPEFFRSVHYWPSGHEVIRSPVRNPSLRPYLHSFAALLTFPPLHDDQSDGVRLRRSDFGAYMSSLHHTEDFVSFALARKRTLPTSRIGQSTDMDLILAKKCGGTCNHDEPRFYDLQQLATAVIRMSDHVFEDPFSTMVLLSSHLDRPRSLYADESGYVWGPGSDSAGDLQRRWAENRIHVIIAMDVFLSFTRCVNRVTQSIVRNRLASDSTSLVFRESLSLRDGRAVFVRENSEDTLPDLVKTWDMGPIVAAQHSMRRRMARLLRLAGSDRDVPWQQCKCTYCTKTDEELEKASREGPPALLC